MKKNILLALTFFVNLGISTSQGLHEGTPTPDDKMLAGTSTGASLGSLHSPNLYDGSTNINIPIYSHQNSYGASGITLSYNTKGVKVDEAVSELGLHWVLNATGSITRTLKDLPDEMNFTTDAGFEANPDLEDYWYPNHNRYLKGKLVTYTETPAQLAVPDVYRDTECDDFTVSVAGLSFTFNLGKNNQIFTHPQRNVKIEVILDGTVISATPGTVVPSISTSPSSYFATDMAQLEFRITDESGVQYYFIKGQTQNEKIYKHEYLENQYTALAVVPTKWLIKTITYPDGNQINFNYSDFIASAIIPLKQDFARENFLMPYDPTYMGSNMEVNHSLNRRINTIQYPNNVSAEFIYSTVDKSETGMGMLDEIKVSSKGNCQRFLIKKHKIDSRRWFLDTVSTSTCDGSIVAPYYTFDYENDIKLPPRLNAGQDFYGYYNGDSLAKPINTSSVEQSKMLIPYHQVATSSTYYGNMRIYDVKYAQAGILKSVSNSLGGKIAFKYKAHSGTYPLTVPPYDYLFGQYQFDGICIDSVIESDKFHPGNSRITTYSFSGGQLFIPGGLFNYPTYSDLATGGFEKLAIQSAFLSAHQLVQGSNHGYSDVSIKTYTNAGSLMGRQDLKFTNMMDATSGGVPRYKKFGNHYYDFPYSDKQYLKDWEMGLPLEVTDYDNNNKLVRKTINSYQFTIDTSATSYISNTKTTLVNAGTSTHEEYWGNFYIDKVSYTDDYSPFTGRSLLLNSVTSHYVTDTRTIQDTVWYQYDNRYNIKATITKNSKGEKLRVNNIYNYSVNTLPGSPIYIMNQAGLEIKVGSERWKIGSTGFTSDSLLNASINTSVLIEGKRHPKAIYELEASAPISYAAYTGYSGGPELPLPYGKVNSAFNGTTPSLYKKSAEVLLMDGEGNPLEAQLGGQSSYNAVVWDTVSGDKLASAANCRYSDIAYASFENNELGSMGSLIVSRGNLTFYVMQTIATLGIGSVTGRNAYRIAEGDMLQHITGKENLKIGKEYLLTFWAKGSVPRVYIGTTLLSIPAAEYTIDGWKYYRIFFTPSVSEKIKFMRPASGATVYLDEIRLTPSNVGMISNTYEALYGVSSSTDENGIITYYEYDKQGRRVIVRDQDKNILSKTSYGVNTVD